MLSAEGSPARTLVSRAREQGLTVSAAAYGRNTPDLLASYDPATSSWKTSQHCLVEGLETFSETWPRSGLMRNGIAYQLSPLVHLTDETEFWIIAYAIGGELWHEPRRRNGTSGLVRPSLQTMASKAMWPTPQEQRERPGLCEGKATDLGWRRSGDGGGTLADANGAGCIEQWRPIAIQQSLRSAQCGDWWGA